MGDNPDRKPANLLWLAWQYASTLHDMNNQNTGPQSPAAVHSAEGAKNPWVHPSLGSHILNICTYDVRTLVGDHLDELLV